MIPDNFKNELDPEIKINTFDKFRQDLQARKEEELKQQLDQTVSKNSKIKETPVEIFKKHNQKIVDEMLDLVFDLLSTALEISETASRGKTGMNHNLDLINLYNRVTKYRRDFSTKYATVGTQERLDLIILKRDLERTIKSSLVKIKSENIKSRMRKF